MNEKTVRARKLRSAQTKAESLLWELLRARQLCGLKFRRQHPIGPFFADFACMSEKLVVELDGGYHEQTCEEDFAREAYLKGAGWQVIRFSNEDVLGNVESVAIAIASTLKLEHKFSKRNRSGSGMMNTKNASEEEPPQRHSTTPPNNNHKGE